MKKMSTICRLLLLLPVWYSVASAQQQMDKLSRGVIAVPATNGVLVSWRLLADDRQDIGFNVYKTVNGKKELLTRKPVAGATCLLDTTAKPSVACVYEVSPAIAGKGVTGIYKMPSNAQPYLSIPLRTMDGYTANDISVGDMDGDGDYELVVHQTGVAHDNSHSGLTSPPIFQCYKLDGTFLWQISLGKNIREGAHYTQFMVYDLDGDGKAEVVMKTADGTIDGMGKPIGDSSKDYRYAGPEQGKQGRILDGPEYLTVFNGLTGAAMATVPYTPGRGDIGGWGGGGGNRGNDRYGNRVDRFLACVAYLDGKRPSVVMCRGYYGRTVLAAWDWRDNKLTQRWVFDTKNANNPYSGMGNHNLAVADVDNDGKDEIIYGSMCVDDDGRGLYTTGLRHGDAVHVTDIDPDRKGLEVFGVHEIEDSFGGPGSAMFDAATGKIIWSGDPGTDVGRGMCADIDPRYYGLECWGGPSGLRDAKGNVIGKSPRSVNFRIWWDGDLLSELLDDTRIDKWDYNNSVLVNLMDAKKSGCRSNNGTKATPGLCADILGDWREEVIFRSADNKELRIFSTPYPTDYRFVTLMQDHVYRLSIAWQNVGYNQPAYTGFYLGEKRPGLANAREEKVDTGFHVYLLMGQSNMAGRGKLDGVTNVNSNILMLDSTGKWQIAKDPVHFDKPGSTGVGPAIAFAEEMQKGRKAGKIGLIPCAWGGSPIKVWKPGAAYFRAHPYDDAIKAAKLAMKSGVLKGVLWHQGESDNDSSRAAVYINKLSALIAGLRADLDIPDLPFIAGEIGYFNKVNYINKVIAQLPGHAANTAVVTADGLTDKGDKLHFDAASARELGRRYAHEMMMLQGARR